VHMAYSDFSLELVQSLLKLEVNNAALFAHAPSTPLPLWLSQWLERARPFALGSEKARSEFIVAPVLLAVRELALDRVALYSGQRLDSDASQGLVGECDFIITAGPPLPIVQSPLLCVVEAKKNDVESGLGQCAAQMVGAQRLNARGQSARAHPGPQIMYGCVTTGEAWQFLRLEGQSLSLDSERYYWVQLEQILGIFGQILHPWLEALDSNP